MIECKTTNGRLRAAVRRAIPALAMSMVGAQAGAQNTPDASTTAAPGETITEIVVTATRREERLQDVPLSVSAVSGDQLENAGVKSLADISQAVSGITFGQTPNDQGFRVRGVGTFGGFASASESPVGVVLDGVVLAVGSAVDSLADIDHVEVLKGPQGTQFGKNASAGVVSIATQRPTLGRFEGGVWGQYGSLNERDVRANLNIPLGDAVAARISVYDKAHDGYIDNVVRNEEWGGDHQYGGRAKLLIEPSARWSVVLIGDFSRDNLTGPGQQWTVAYAPPSIVPEFTSVGVTPSPRNTRSAEWAPGSNTVKRWGASAELNLHLGDGYTLTSVSAYRRQDSGGIYSLDAVPEQVFLGTGPTKSTQTTEELRLTSPSGGLFEYVAGYYYYHQPTDSSGSAWLRVAQIPFGPALYASIQNGVNFNSTVTDSNAVFADGSVRLTDQLHLLAGVRYTRDTVDATSVSNADLLSPGLPLPPGILLPATSRPFEKGRTSASEGSGRLGLEYKPSADLMFYGTAARGYLGPTVTFSVFSGTETNVKPQTVNDVTVGAKTQWFSGALTLNGDVFYDKYKDLQVSTFDVAAAEFLTRNAGGARSQGAEFDVTARVQHDLTLRASAAYTDAKFTDFVTSCPAEQLVASQCYTLPGSTTALYQAAGKRLPGAPRWTSVIGADYRHSWVRDLFASASFNYSYRTQTFYGVGTVRDSQGGYGLASAFLRLGTQDDKWHLGVYARNLFDKVYQAGVLEGIPFGPSDALINWNARDARRTVGVEAAVNF